MDEGANDIIQLITTVTVIGAMFLIIAPQVGWLAIVPMPLIIWGSLRFQRLLEPHYAGVREQVSVLNSQLANNLGGIATIKSFTTEEYELASVREASDEYRQRNQDAIKVSSGFVPIIRMVIVTGFIAIMFFGGLLVLNGQLNVGAYSVLVFMTQRLLWPLTSLGNTLDQYQRAMASTNRVMNLLDTEAEIVSGTAALPIEEVAGEIRFEEVDFEYGLGQNKLSAAGASNGNGDGSISAPGRAPPPLAGDAGGRNHRFGWGHWRRQEHHYQTAAALL